MRIGLSLALLLISLVAAVLLVLVSPQSTYLWLGGLLVVGVLFVGLAWSVAREAGVGPRPPLYAALFVWIAVAMGVAFLRTLEDLAQAELLPRQLAAWTGPDAPAAARYLVAGVGGLWAAILAIGLLIGAGTLAAAQRLRPTTDQRGSSLLLRALRRSLGLVPAEWVVRAGKVETVRAPKPPQKDLVGPGELEVQQGHVVVLERDGVITDLKGTGVHWVRPMERIAMCVPLYGRGATVTVNDAETGDGVRVEVLEINVFHKLAADNGQPVVENGGFPFAPAVIKERVWSPSGSDWTDAVVAITRREAIKLIGRHTLSSFLTLLHGDYNAFKAQLEEQINAVTLSHLGVRVSVTGIGKLQLPAAVVQALTEAALWDIQREIEYDRARIEGAITEEVARHRRDAFMLMFGALHDAAQLHPDVGQLLKMALLERLEREGLGGRQREGSGQREDVDSLLKLLALDVLRGLPAEGSAADLRGLGGGRSRPEGDGPEPSHGSDGSPRSDGEG